MTILNSTKNFSLTAMLFAMTSFTVLSGCSLMTLTEEEMVEMSKPSCSTYDCSEKYQKVTPDERKWGSNTEWMRQRQIEQEKQD